VESEEVPSIEKPEPDTRENQSIAPASSGNGKPVWIEPDLDFIRSLRRRGGDLFKKCMQCGTCSATCALSPDTKPFPAKEMAWAAWGMKDQLLNDSDIWLCFQCNDCSMRCPRGARPGDLLAMIRQESVAHHAFPGFLGRWVNQPQYIPFLLGIPAALLGLVLYLKGPLESAFGITRYTGERIVFSYSSKFPHWLLNSFFAMISLLVLIAVIIGVGRFWKAMKSAGSEKEISRDKKGLFPSIVSALQNIITHKNFTECTIARPRYLSHLSVFFGFTALSMVSLWVFTSGINPLLQMDFVYPFSFWSPWKILANLGGLALAIGCCLMIYERFKGKDKYSPGTFFDWYLIGMLLVVVLTGFFTEVLHYVRLEPHRHIIYFIHLVFACGLLMYLPYSKLAHIIYRAVAMVYAEYSGRDENVSPGETGKKQ